MCSQSMENYQGDLTDIFRASGKSLIMLENEEKSVNWEFNSDPMNFDVPKDNFGDPFSSIIRDPLLHELDSVGSSFFNGPNSMNSMFPQLLQISSSNVNLPLSPSDSPAGSSRVSGDMINVNSLHKGCLVDNSPVQISSPRNPGIKRRKSQAKKVICVPAPAAANSRPSSGEVVPSDLWAWRKYGQKPIKGSPYPRGYYRCSSSKGCSARKQVERSRTDPNMLVITYTSEHNHAWPTQRNALAGSTRAQPSKTNANSRTSSSSALTKEEEKNKNNNLGTCSSSVKEEIKEIEKIEMEDDDDFSEGFPHYRPEMPNPNNHGDDFFADLGEIETDPLNLLFSQGFNEDEQKETNKELDPFSIFGWSGETKKGL